MQKIIGIDEAGRGPWAGPVIASAFVFLKKTEITKYLKDSKKISKNRRELLFKELQVLKNEGYCNFEIGIIESSIIDKIGIKKANKLAMEKALSRILFNLKNGQKYTVQIDGKDNYVFDDIKNPVEFIIKGDDKIDEIKAASIIAKVTRDQIMVNYGLEFPVYKFEKHAGYGTKLHYEAIKKYGICDIHRKSFAPIKNWLDFNQN